MGPLRNHILSRYRLIMGKLRYHAQGMAPAKAAVGQSLKMEKDIQFCQIPRRNKLTKSCGALACTYGPRLLAIYAL